MAIRCLVFDVGYTLVDEDLAQRYRMERLLAACDPALSLTVDALMLMYEDCASRNHGDPMYPLLARLGVARERRDEFPYGKDMEKVYPEVEPTLRALKGSFRMGVLANQSPGLPGRIRKYGLEQYFEFIIGSGDVGFRKPQKEIFELGEKSANCRPGEMLMVGDRIDNDVAPAKSARWKTALIRRGIHRNKQPDNPGEVPDYEIVSLTELSKLLEDSGDR